MGFSTSGFFTWNSDTPTKIDKESLKRLKTSMNDDECAKHHCHDFRVYTSPEVSWDHAVSFWSIQKIPCAGSNPRASGLIFFWEGLEGCGWYQWYPTLIFMTTPPTPEFFFAFRGRYCMWFTTWHFGTNFNVESESFNLRPRWAPIKMSEKKGALQKTLGTDYLEPDFSFCHQKVTRCH